MKPEKRIELTNRLNPDAVMLARWVCLATRIEPALIRRARLRLMPGGNSGTESDLWFSPLIQTVGARYILIYPEVSNVLRRQLAGNRKDFARAWKVTRETHRSLPELVRLEEKLTWLALKDDPRLERKLDALLRPLIKAILTGQREGLGRWALNVLPHLPEHARASKSARLLRMIAESQLYGGWANLLTTIGDGPNDEEAALLLHGLERTTAGLQLSGDSLEVSEPPEEGARLIKVPATNPRVLELSWPYDDQQQSARLMWKKGEQGRAAGVRFPLSVNTLAGDSHQITPGIEIIGSHLGLVSSYLVSILDANNQPVGLGVRVENDFILTTIHSIRNAAPESLDRLQNQPVRFSLQPSERFSMTRQVRGEIPPDSAFPTVEPMSTDYPLLLQLHEGAMKTRAAKLKSAFDLKGRVLLAPGMLPSGEPAKWAAFEVGEATETGDFALIPATQISSDKLSRWSGAPLVDGTTGDVAGMLLVNKGEDARARLISLDQISRAFPEIFNAGSKVLLTYSHLDHELVKEFRFRMEALGLGDKLVFWVDSRLNEPPWMEQTAPEMETATAVVLFVSADYLASDFMVEDEFLRFLRRAEERGATILPVILSPSEFSKTTLARYQAVNDPGEPFTTLTLEGRDRVFERLSEILFKQLGVKPAERSQSQSEFTRDFFISFHPADGAWAAWIAWQLDEGGYSTFITFPDRTLSSSLLLEMERQMKQSAYTVAVLSPDYLESAQKELATTLVRDPIGQPGGLVPVRVRECEPTGLLASLAQLDLVGLSERDATFALVDRLRKVHPKPVETQGLEKRSLERVPFPIPVPAPTPEPTPPRPIMPFWTDVFISYARPDNEPLDDDRGWVDHLVERLTSRLSQLGKKLTTFLDRGPQGPEYFDGVIKQLTETRLFVPIITPRYLQSEWCAAELREFLQRAAETGGVTIGDRSRIFAVHKSLVSREELPEVLSGSLGFQFYEIDDYGRPLEFSLQTESERDLRYWNRLDDLAQDIMGTLEIIEPAENAPHQRKTAPLSPEDIMRTLENIPPAENAPLPAEVPAPPPDMTVYLAEVASDVAGERVELRIELQARGYRVLPDEDPLLKSPEYQNAVREGLARSQLSIHLIGSSYGFVPEGEERSVVILQAELAAERAAADPSFSRLLWMSPDLRPKGRRQQAFVEQLQSRLAPADEFLQMPLEDLKARILEKLNPPAAA